MTTSDKIKNSCAAAICTISKEEVMKSTNVDKNSREHLEQQLKSARANLVLMLIFTVVNIVLLLVESDRYFLFSASIPYYLTLFGSLFAKSWGIPGLYPAGIALAAVILLIYLVIWLVSKKHPGLLIAGLVFFALDTIAFLGLTVMADAFAESIIDIAFHIWVLVYLGMGISAGSKLKKMPEKPVVTQENILDVDIDHRSLS